MCVYMYAKEFEKLPHLPHFSTFSVFKIPMKWAIFDNFNVWGMMRCVGLLPFMRNEDLVDEISLIWGHEETGE